MNLAALISSGRARLVVAAPWVPTPTKARVCYFCSTRPTLVALIAKFLVGLVGIDDAGEHSWLDADLALDTADDRWLARTPTSHTCFHGG